MHVETNVADVERWASAIGGAALAAVEQLDDRRAHWKAKGPARRIVEWDAEIINEIPHELIGWRTLDGADVVSAAVAWLFGREPSRTIRDDLRRFKR
jgi:uncharacterized membrane protein